MATRANTPEARRSFVGTRRPLNRLLTSQALKVHNCVTAHRVSLRPRRLAPLTATEIGATRETSGSATKSAGGWVARKLLLGWVLLGVGVLGFPLASHVAR